MYNTKVLDIITKNHVEKIKRLDENIKCVSREKIEIENRLTSDFSRRPDMRTIDVDMQEYWQKKE